MISEDRINANRINSAKGGEVNRQKYAELYEANPTYCSHCGIKLPQKKQNNKFCSSSCAASYNNKIVKRKIRPPCEYCGKEVKRPKGRFCSPQCCANSRKTDIETKRAKNAAAQAAYRAKYGYMRGYDESANKEKIKEIYLNCPLGYEVDHIIPLSRGGLHHEDNLQYLTITENRVKSNKI